MQEVVEGDFVNTFCIVFIFRRRLTDSGGRPWTRPPSATAHQKTQAAAWRDTLSAFIRPFSLARLGSMYFRRTNTLLRPPHSVAACGGGAKMVRTKNSLMVLWDEQNRTVVWERDHAREGCIVGCQWCRVHNRQSSV